MKIGILSDTHLPEMGRFPPAQVARAFAGVDLILHAGDIRTSDCLDWLERIAPVLAVEIAPAPVIGDPRVQYRRILEFEGYTIGMTHDFQLMGMGWEIVPGIIGARFPLDRSLSEAVAYTFGRPVDTVVFGHTHIALVEEHRDILFVNPGSATLPKQVRKLGTVALLELGPAGRSAQILQLADFPV